MKTLLKVVIVSGLLSLSAQAQDVKLGEAHYKKCTSCHGNDGLGKASQKAPMLAGQYAWYVQTQIKNIKDGKRSNENTKKMLPFVKSLSDKDIADIAAYIESMPYKK